MTCTTTCPPLKLQEALHKIAQLEADNAALQAENLELKTERDYCSVTGVLRGEAFMPAAERYAATHPDAVIMFIDLDNFRYFNNHYNHDVGDLVLVAAAEKLKATFGATGIVGRSYRGGDEFVVVTTFAIAKAAFAKGLTASIKNPKETVTMSVGWARTTGIDFAMAKRGADVASQIAKASTGHRGGVVEHDPIRHPLGPIESRPRRRQEDQDWTNIACPSSAEQAVAA